MSTATPAICQFNTITQGGKIGSTRGLLKFTNTNITWKSDGGRSDNVNISDITEAKWIRITPKIFQLKLSLKGGNSIKFDGFREQDSEVVRKYLKENIGIELENAELSTKGSNWGIVNVNGSNVQFMNDNKVGFEFSVSEVSQSVFNPNHKNELTLEFRHDKTLNDEDEAIVEIRFYTPTRPAKEIPDKKENEQGEEEEEEEEEEEPQEEEMSTLQIFQQSILEKSDIVSNVGKGLAVISNVHFLIPRGRLDIEIYSTFLKLHGKTHDHKVPFENISRLFKLEKSDQKSIFYVISLEPPLRQGKTKYSHLLIQIPNEEETTLELNLTDEQLIKYKGLTPTMSGSTVSVLSTILKVLSGKKTLSDSSFLGESGTASVKCSLKASEGSLYPLERAFFFIHKPPTYIKYEDITNVEFARLASVSVPGGLGNSRTFDLIVNLKNATSVQFTNILREEYRSLFNYLNERKIKIDAPTQASSGIQMAMDEDDSDDSDYEPSESDDDDDDDDDEEESEEEKKPKKKSKKGK
ncbi:hypothetical protein CYY_006674 [Polysphondylium violaceum]|uniref:FACT complex subunit SSRP1 n=1 Tax=Polysphondylium violaceum TaxID=133409 RepID=A0A8J4PZA8_9MYCE|nr:hypothetical protein CYY_006674 [Polysphondylium violaceum]